MSDRGWPLLPHRLAGSTVCTGPQHSYDLPPVEINSFITASRCGVFWGLTADIREKPKWLTSTKPVLSDFKACIPGDPTEDSK